MLDLATVALYIPILHHLHPTSNVGYSIHSFSYSSSLIQAFKVVQSIKTPSENLVISTLNHIIGTRNTLDLGSESVIEVEFENCICLVSRRKNGFSLSYCSHYIISDPTDQSTL